VKEFGWQEPLGKRIVGPVGSNDRGDRAGQVVGVVKDFNFASLYCPIDPLIIILEGGNRYLYVKIQGDKIRDTIIGAESIYRKIFPEYPFEFEWLNSKYKSLYQRDYDAQVIFRFGLVISLIISGLGIFSISSLTASLRQKESGIRKIIGASTLQLFGLHIRRFFLLLFVALLIAFPTIFVVSNYWLNSFAYKVELGIIYYLLPTTIAIVTIIVIAGFHGVKSARVNPANVLRAE
jgi:putative ABC transport system permease protein